MVREIRLQKLKSLVKQRVAGLISHELSDPRSSFITVTRVNLDREIKVCTIYYSVLGNEKDRKLTGKLLDHAKGHVRSEIAKILTTRNIPEVRFKYDPSIEEGLRLGKLIDKVVKKDRELEEKARPKEPEDE